jgi:hypothetical protein
MGEAFRALIAIAAFALCSFSCWAQDPTAPTSAVPASVVSVHDADTLRAVVHLPFGDDIRERAWRAFGYDAWEIDYTRKNAVPPITPEEIKRGKQARLDFLGLLATGQLYLEDPLLSGKEQGSGQTYDRTVAAWWIKRPDGTWIYLAKYADDQGWLRESRKATPIAKQGGER